MDKRSTDPADYQSIAPPVTVLAKDYEHDAYVPPHSHLRAQLLYAISGTMRVSTDHSAWIVPPQRAIWIAPGISHAIRHIGHVSMRTVYITADRNPFAADDCHVVAMTPLMRELILRLLEEPPDYALQGAAFHTSELILAELPQLVSLPLHIPLPQDKRLQRLCRHILDHPRENGHLDTYATIAGTSSRNLQRLFHKECGMTFGAWHQQVKLLEALGKMSQGERISDVARHLDYRSPSAFTAMFRRSFGISPSEFMKKSLNDG